MIKHYSPFQYINGGNKGKKLYKQFDGAPYVPLQSHTEVKTKQQRNVKQRDKSTYQS